MAQLIILLLILEKVVFGLANGEFNFTSKPDDKAIFVGNGKKSVIFKWTFFAKRKTDIKFIQFGYVEAGSDYKSVVVKEFKNGSFHFVNKNSDENSRKNRIYAAEDAEAKFTFKNLRLNDTGKYFCGVKYSYYIRRSVVELLVEDLEINKASSTNFMEVWKGHEMRLMCVVNVAEGVTPVFEWRRQSDGALVNGRAKQHNEARLSTLKLFPYFEYEFDNYVCVAKTGRTAKNHTVTIRRLYEPAAPNLRESKTFDQDRVYPKIHWTEPANGGSPIVKYIVEFKPVGIPWSKATKEYVNLTVYLMNKLKPGRTYDVRVVAKNKVGTSIPSNNLAVKYFAANWPQGSHSSAGRWTPNVSFIIFNGLLVYLGTYLS